MIHISAEGIEDVRRRFERLVPAARDQALKGLAQTAYDSANTSVDQHTQTGALIRSLSLRPEGPDAWIVGHEAHVAPYAPFVHWGTRPHVIKPKARKRLRWVHGNGFVFAPFVKHPGYVGDPWLVSAADAAIQNFDRIVQSIDLER